MSEPRAVADAVEEVVRGVWHWRLSDERIDGAISAAHAVTGEAGVVLIDPLPLTEAALAGLGPLEAICLTAQCHQRSAWRLRRRFAVPVVAPKTRPMEEEPDRHYTTGDLLPGGLRAIHTPGPEEVHYSFLLERGDEPGVLFLSDALYEEKGRLEFVPPEHHDDPPRTRRCVESLLELPFSVLCLDHGAPLLEDPKSAIRELLTRTAEPAA